MSCCGGAPAPPPEAEPPKPQEPDPEKVKEQEEMAKVRAALAASKDEPGFKRDKTFKKRFKGFKVRGTPISTATR
jgi:hypothetical protein